MRGGNNRIEYQSGEKIGECIYLYDVNPHFFPSGKWVRKAKFECLLCGSKFETFIRSVKNGETKSCGCLSSSNLSQKTHGMSGTSIHHRWKSMKNRCYNPNNAEYADYGGRGIRICKEWRNDFIAFYNFVSNLPNYGKKGYSLDRDDNDGNYEPNNVKWSTRHHQNTNKRPRKNISGYTGVSKKGNRYQAIICVNYKNIYIGSYKTALEAATARDQYIIDNELWEYTLQVIYHKNQTS